MTNELFFDTSYAIAISSKRDALHTQAKFWAQKIKADGIRLVTTQAVLLEIGNALAKLKYRQTVIALLENLEGDPNALIIFLTDELYEEGF